MKASKRLLSLVAAGLAIGLAMSDQTAGQPPAPGYTFTKIADGNSGPWQFNTQPSINAHGTVAVLANAGDFIIVGDGGPLQVLYDTTSGPFSGGGFGGHPAISDNGLVAFIANHPSLGQGVFAGDGGAPTPIHLGGGFANVDINASGQVGFSTTIGGVRGVFVGNGGVLTTIADDSGPLFAFDDVTINESGQAAFHATLDAGGDVILRGDGSSLTTIADSSGPLTLRPDFQQASVSDDGTVAFMADLDAGGEGVFAGNGGPIATIATTGPGFVVLDNQGPAISGSGLVVFRAENPDGIYTGSDPISDKVIAVGDRLDGSFPTGFFLGTKSINDAGQIAFAAVIGGKVSIFRADPDIAVTIDIIPRKAANRVNVKKKGNIPVAILSDAVFDASTVDTATVAFGPSGAGVVHVGGHIDDVNSDGFNDLLLHFKTPDTGITCGDTSASLTGTTFGGQAIDGTDSLVAFPCK